MVQEGHGGELEGQHPSLFPCLVQEGQGGELEGQHPAPLSGTGGSVGAVHLFPIWCRWYGPGKQGAAPTGTHP